MNKTIDALINEFFYFIFLSLIYKSRIRKWHDKVMSTDSEKNNAL